MLGAAVAWDPLKITDLLARDVRSINWPYIKIFRSDPKITLTLIVNERQNASVPPPPPRHGTRIPQFMFGVTKHARGADAELRFCNRIGGPAQNLVWTLDASKGRFEISSQLRPWQPIG